MYENEVHEVYEIEMYGEYDKIFTNPEDDHGF